jgi:aspartyl-tRNA synthetase
MMRSHTCGELRASHDGERVTLCGWVQNRRDHGGLLFIDLRDREGVTQAVVEPEAPEAARIQSDRVRLEWVVQVEGVVRRRPPESSNPDRETGEVEVVVDRFQVLNAAQPMPVTVMGEERSSEDLGLQYRYLEMRRPEVKRALVARAEVNRILREEMIEGGFVEVETPSLLRSTPEGARDYLVPSRVHPGHFYALLQSPQILKQLLMVGGLDRYWQIVRCFRDEDLRADRQPEFTQLDVEMSFVGEDDVQRVAEDLVRRLVADVAGVELPQPFPRMTYADAVARYGSDKPDLRFDLPVHDVTEVVKDCAFGVFSGSVKAGGMVRAIALPAAHNLTRRQLDGLPAVVADRGARGVAWVRLPADGWTGAAAKHLTDDEKQGLLAATGAETGGILLFLAGPEEVVVPASGDLRLHLARTFGLIEPGKFAPVWIEEFPLLERDEERDGWVARHHPFTAWNPDDEALLDTDPGAVRARAYDLAMNGYELLGGSIRIHDPAAQLRLLEVIGMPEAEARERFGFLLDGLQYGAPPHGGFAMGTDRLVTILLGLSQIRDVIAFPKTTSAQDLMTGAPSPVDAGQLGELGLRLVPDSE